MRLNINPQINGPSVARGSILLREVMMSLNASSPKTIVVKCIEEKWSKKKNTVAKCPLC